MVTRHRDVGYVPTEWGAVVWGTRMRPGSARRRYGVVPSGLRREDKPLAWWFPAIPLVFIVFGLLYRRYGTPTESQRGFMVLCIGVAMLLTTMAGCTVVWQRHSALRMLNSGRYAVVEGIVEDFERMPRHAQGTRERFRVGEVVFDYRTNEVSPYFNQTAVEGGPIHEGLPVRVAYVWDSSRPPTARILRLEVLE